MTRCDPARASVWGGQGVLPRRSRSTWRNATLNASNGSVFGHERAPSRFLESRNLTNEGRDPVARGRELPCRAFSQHFGQFIVIHEAQAHVSSDRGSTAIALEAALVERVPPRTRSRQSTRCPRSSAARRYARLGVLAFDWCKFRRAVRFILCSAMDVALRLVHAHKKAVVDPVFVRDAGRSSGALGVSGARGFAAVPALELSQTARSLCRTIGVRSACGADPAADGFGLIRVVTTSHQKQHERASQNEEVFHG